MSAFAVPKPRQQVYVDVPPSPYPIAPSYFRQSGSKHHPLQPFNGDAPRSLSDTPFLKRKTSKTASLITQSSPTKKQKVAETSALTLSHTEPNACVYCHQCSKKYDTSVAIRCTEVHTIKGVEKQCNIKMCIACLKNHYGEDHGAKVNGAYSFKCPKCRYICNCRACMKVKGLPPTGKLYKPGDNQSLPAPKSLPKNKVEVLITSVPPSGSSRKGSGTTKRKPAQTKPLAQTKAGAKPAQQTLRKMLPETLPILNWNDVPTNLNLRDTEARLQIREFVLRFASVMQPIIPRSQLAELDNLGSSSDDDDELVPWVSEACVRSMILGLLGMLASLEGPMQKPLKSAIREIRATGNILTKIWPILARLRDDNSQLSFPDPLPPPAAGAYYTRTTRSEWNSNSGQSNIIIGRSAQFVPVMGALIEAAFDTPTVREELENGSLDAKEMTRDVQKAIKDENERWDEERKALEAQRENLDKDKDKGKSKTKTPSEVKLRREVHKERIRDLENALKLVVPGFAPRFTPLGTDSAGRVFWALSPGAVERRVAQDFIASVTNVKKVTLKVHITGDTALTDWSCFVAVWGKKIPAAGTKTRSDIDGEDNDVERWWAFTESVEIRKLADWIRIDAGIDPHVEADANKPPSLLVKGLNEYATMLDWRRKEDKYGSVIA